MKLAEGGTRALFICSDHRIPSSVAEGIELLSIETEDQKQTAGQASLRPFQTKHSTTIKRFLAAIGANVDNLDIPKAPQNKKYASKLKKKLKTKGWITHIKSCSS